MISLKEYYKQILNSHLIEGNEPKRKINVRIKYRGPHLTWGGSGGDNNEQPQEPQEPLTVKGIINSLRLNAKLMRQDARGAVGDLNTDFPVVGRAIGAVKRFFTRRKRSSKKISEENITILNELGDTARGQNALRSYIGRRSVGIGNIERQNTIIDSSIRSVTNRLRDERTNTDRQRQIGMQLVGMEKGNNRKLERYNIGIDRALRSITPKEKTP